MRRLVTLQTFHLNKDHYFTVNGLAEDVDGKKSGFLS